MQEIDGWQMPPAWRGAVLALGNCDGVHRGHQALLAAARALAAAATPWGLLTFAPHPRRFFQPEAPPFLLQTAVQKAAILADLGADLCVNVPFDAALAAMPAPVFAQRLAETLGLAAVVVGDGFRFGHDRTGDADLLARFLPTHRVPPALDDAGVRISSSRIRALLQDGQMPAAAALLGRPFATVLPVVHGAGRGALLAVATANMILPADQLRPRYGVYVVRAHWDARRNPLAGVANFGVRPTVDGQSEQLEVHLFDMDTTLYGQTLCVEWLDFLRPERRFADLPSLQQQIALDLARARAWHAG